MPQKVGLPILTPHQFPLLVRTGLSIITGFFLKKNNDDGKYIHCFLPYIVIVGIEPVANSFLFFLYNSITLLFLLKSKTDSTINPKNTKPTTIKVFPHSKKSSSEPTTIQTPKQPVNTSKSFNHFYY